MVRRMVVLFGVVLAVTAGVVFQASAFAEVDSYFLGCDHVTASGTTDAPFVVVEVYDPAVGEDLFFGTFPTNGGTFDINAGFATQANYSTLEYWVWGSPTDDPEDWDGEDYFFFEGSCTPSGGAPGIPAGFVFRSMLCDTPVYNTAAGQPVGDARVTAGQTWYVNPTPVDGADGRQWTEIFVSSTTNPFVPTECVN